MTLTFLFPGQGSQKVGMGADLFDSFPEMVEQADRALGYSIREICLNDPDGKLGRTQFTQPALFAVNALTCLEFVSKTGRRPDFLAGHSVAEYNALFAAGAFDWETGLRLVSKRGEIMSRADPGAMAAVMGVSAGKTREILDGAGFSGVDIANFNSPNQLVISGLREDIQRARPAFEEAGVRHFIPLNVSGAFHSRYMQPAKEEFEKFLGNFCFKDPEVPVISNVTARPHEKGEVRKNLARQVTHPVQWTESMEFILGKPDPEFIEMGPGTVLTGLLKQIRRGTKLLLAAFMAASLFSSPAFSQTAGKHTNRFNEMTRQEKLGGTGLFIADSLSLYAWNWAWALAVQSDTLEAMAHASFSRWGSSIGRAPVWNDGNGFVTNNVFHPLAGAFYYAYLRSRDHPRWLCATGTFMQSALFEYTIEGQYTTPSSQDLVKTTVIGVALGALMDEFSRKLLSGSTKNKKLAGYALNPMYLLPWARWDPESERPAAAGVTLVKEF